MIQGPVTVQGVKIPKIEVELDAEGEITANGTYHLMSSNGMVLAKQSFNGYNGMKIALSADTQKLARDLLAAIQADVNRTIGLG